MLDDAESPEPLTIPFPKCKETKIFCTCLLHRIHSGVLTHNLKPLLSNIVVWTFAAERFKYAARAFDFHRAALNQHYVPEFFNSFLGQVINIQGLTDFFPNQIRLD
jgi:hypothetical protein